MSQVQPTRWLPSYLATLYRWLKWTEPTWGFTIYRTTYTPRSEAAFPAIVDLITAYVKEDFYKDHKTLLEDSPSANKVDITIFDEMWAKYQPRVIEDAAQFDGASIEQVRSHFEAWANERHMADRFPSYRMFIVIDEESLQSLQDTPIPEECFPGSKHWLGHYVKLVEAWQEPEHPFMGWMKCSLRGLWDVWRNMQDGDYMRKSYVLICKYRDVY
ncbi:hypothetical protein PMG11_10982 [Penicillium brasilianum]|uniref:Uncharacterized protein n=1 Tax=Penicillium brasilianum TaxID=104259 RepID=A0A0F7U459_PENBI|nr:hypothetical protein PMG11_10982 [Penicillium brasilianum]